MRARGLAIAAGACALVWGCAGGGGQGSGGSSSGDQPVRIVREERTPSLPETLGSSAPGLEVLAWTADDYGSGRAGALREFTEPPPAADEGALSRWERSGLRAVVVPLDRLGSVLTVLPPQGQLQRAAWGQASDWRALLATGEPKTPGVAIHDGVLRVGELGARLLARGWVEPEVSSGRLGSRVRAELVPQLVRPDDRSRLGAPIELHREADAGPVLGDLILSVAISPGTALVIVGEDPGRDWNDTDVGSAGAVRGPPIPRIESLGELLLVESHEAASDANDPHPPSRVRVLVLVAVTPEGPPGGPAGEATAAPSG